MSFHVDQNIPARRNLRIRRKPIYTKVLSIFCVYFLYTSMFDLRYSYVCYILINSRIRYFYYSWILTRFQAPSPRHRCGSRSSSRSSPSLPLLDSWRPLDKQEFKSWYPPRNGDMCVVTETIWSRRSFPIQSFPSPRPTIPYIIYIGRRVGAMKFCLANK